MSWNLHCWALLGVSLATAALLELGLDAFRVTPAVPAQQEWVAGSAAAARP